jgi:hypothetical protein
VYLSYSTVNTVAQAGSTPEEGGSSSRTCDRHATTQGAIASAKSCGSTQRGGPGAQRDHSRAMAMGRTPFTIIANGEPASTLGSLEIVRWPNLATISTRGLLTSRYSRSWRRLARCHWLVSRRTALTTSRSRIVVEIS